MAKFAFVNLSGNVPGRHHDFEIHACGCRDLDQLKKHRVHIFSKEAASAEALVVKELKEFQEYDMGYTEDDFRIMPCCSK